jgi:hypothetical protein
MSWQRPWPVHIFFFPLLAHSFIPCSRTNMVDLAPRFIVPWQELSPEI